jgi:hypothetical protein
MKSGISLQELAATIESQKALKHDFIVPTAALSVFATNGGDQNKAPEIRLTMPATGVDMVDRHIRRHIEYGGGCGIIPQRGGLEIRPIMHSQLSDKLGIPKKYYDRMATEAPALLAENVNVWLGSATDTKGRPAKNMVRTLDGTARAFLSQKYNCLDNAQLAEAALPAIMESGATVESCEITERKMYLKCVRSNMEPVVIWPEGTPEHAKVLGQGHIFGTHILRPGISIGTSEVGQGKVFASPLLHESGCSNLTVMSEDTMSKVHLGRAQGSADGVISEIFSDDTKRKQDAVLYAEIADLTRAALDGQFFLKYVESVKVSLGLKIATDDLAAVVDVTAEKFDLSDGERDSVLRHLIEGRELNAYGLSAAVTRASADVDDYDRASDLEKIGGNIIELNPNDWAVVGMFTPAMQAA